jgi:hypothetical protein
LVWERQDAERARRDVEVETAWFVTAPSFNSIHGTSIFYDAYRAPKVRILWRPEFLEIETWLLGC